MQLETLSKVKGWIALVSLIVTFACVFAMADSGSGLGTFALGGVCGWLAIIFGIGWFRTRSRIRAFDYQARAFQKKGY